MKNVHYLLLCALFMVSCNQEKKNEDGTKTDNALTVESSELKTALNKMKKYSNEDFYVNGKLSPEKTLNAYKEMMAFYDYPVDPWLLDHMFITDFGLGDFVNVGMAGVFWINDAEGGYFGHEIFLLPGQMIAEHSHLKTEHPPKMESWQVRHGMTYNFGIAGNTAGMPPLPESQNGHIKSDKYVITNRGGLSSLAEAESPHFMLAGTQGTIVTEYANYHDGAGLRFTNPDIEFTDILGNN